MCARALTHTHTQAHARTSTHAGAGLGVREPGDMSAFKAGITLTLSSQY